ncbi:hypothetical protein P5V15_008170 [Pogonomyrmex californicus]
MTCIETQYFSLNKTLLLAMGLWPYKRSTLIRLQFIFFFSILISAIVFQLTVFLTSKYTIDLVIKVITTVLSFSIFVINYISFAVNFENIKYLIMQLQDVYSTLKNEYENAIIKRYNYSAQWYTSKLTVLSICGSFTFIIVQYYTNILDIALLRNVSQSRHLPIIMEYFIDHEKYFYLIMLHIHVAFCIGLISMVAIGTMLIAYIQHICGILKISSYRIKHIMGIATLQNIILKNEDIMFNEIICAVDIHRHAMRLSELLVSKFELMLLCLIFVEVIALSLNLFRVITYSQDDIKEYVLSFLFALIIILYMFLVNYMGQNIIDHSNHIFITVCSIQWYLAPLHIQKIIFFLLQRTSKTFSLSIGGIFYGSLECFATVLKTSISYFTVIYSVQ